MYKRIHIMGASGSGTTTLGKNLEQAADYKHLDSDEFYWQKTEPPYTVARAPKERLTLLQESLKGYDKWVLSGSIADWGNALIPQFDLVVFLYLPHNIRIERLKQCEYLRCGKRIDKGGDMYDKSREFIEWAAGYDDSSARVGRTLEKHKQWLQQVTCPILKITGEITEKETLAKVLEYINFK